MAVQRHFVPPGSHAAIFYLVFFRVTQHGVSKRWTSDSLFLFGFNKELYPLALTYQQLIKLFHITICYTVVHKKKKKRIHLICLFKTLFAPLVFYLQIYICIYVCIGQLVRNIVTRFCLNFQN